MIFPRPAEATPGSPDAPAPSRAASWVVPQLRALVEGPPAWPRESAPTDALPPTRSSAVLLLFGAADPHAARPEDLDLLVVRRAMTLRHHPGQVAVPGGGVEPGDADLVATALREAQEETGARPEGIDVVGELPAFPVHVSRNLTTPVVAWWREPSPVWVADTRELDLVRRVPLAVLLDPARRVRAEIPRRTVAGEPRDGRRWTPAIELDEALMWGFTGIVVTTVLEALGWAAPTDWRAVRPVNPLSWSPSTS